MDIEPEENLVLGVGVVTVRGRSMEPTLRGGDRVLVLRGVRPRLGRMAIVSLPPDPDGAPRPLAVKRVTRRDPQDASRYWVERDNPHEGVDSWQVGSIAREQVHALVVCRMPGRRAVLSGAAVLAFARFRGRGRGQGPRE